MLRFSGLPFQIREGRVPGQSLMVSTYLQYCSSLLMLNLKWLLTHNCGQGRAVRMWQGWGFGVRKEVEGIEGTEK